ncbi:fidgetin-like protein 1 [Malaya genurostris]|uniref:fidgetin-like protein 1 n=1 Tax=Malaya genurostris TaxID=325434 RepID=UPI0026F3C1A6|nr:fidgetin-like protein 1 [Malaya genurostris]
MIMENIGETEAYILHVLKTADSAKQEKDSFKKVDLLRTSTSQLFAEALRSNDERFACSLLQCHLDTYQEAVIDPDSVNNYCDEVLNLLETQTECDEKDEKVIEEIALGDPLSYLTEKRHCKGCFEDCVTWQLDDNLTKSVFKQKTLTNENASNINHVSASLNSNELLNMGKIKSRTVQELSRRIFDQKKSESLDNVPKEEERNCNDAATSSFRTAKDELQIQNLKKYGNVNPPGKTPLFAYGKKSLGGRRTLGSRFVCPIRDESTEKPAISSQGSNHSQNSEDEEIDERLRHIDPKMIELIRSEIMDRFTPLTWDDIAGLDYAKTTIQEAVVWPILRPDIFTGLRRPPRGILLFGPPGTGKTLIGKCIASQSKSTFFSISASSLTSKWIGDGEKMVRALFAVATVHQPAVVFIDEIDSLLCQRSETEHESSRRLKTEFLVQLDGAATGEDDRILIVGATNRPQELDEAARRRLVKRLYIPLPELSARIKILSRLLANEKSSLLSDEMTVIGQLTEGFSGADMKVLCHEASMGPIRSIPFEQLSRIGKDEVRPVCYADFKNALERVRASVSQKDLTQYVQWDRCYGSGASC